MRCSITIVIVIEPLVDQQVNTSHDRISQDFSLHSWVVVVISIFSLIFVDYSSSFKIVINRIKFKKRCVLRRDYQWLLGLNNEPA